MSEAFGSSSTSTIFGTSASTFLQRATSVCAITFLVTSLSLAVLSSHRSRSLMDLERIKRALPQAERREIPVEKPLEGLPIDVEEKEKSTVKEEGPAEE